MCLHAEENELDSYRIITYMWWLASEVKQYIIRDVQQQIVLLYALSSWKYLYKLKFKRLGLTQGFLALQSLNLCLVAIKYIS